MLKRLFIWIQRYERMLSAVSMVAGAAFDQFFLGRVDVARTQIVLASYVVTCFISIPLLHFLEARAERGGPHPRWRVLLPLATQFALGGFWSAFFVFYGRSAVLSASWPFVLLVVAALIGNELFKKYHDRLVFTSLLFFFALYGAAIFELPVLLGAMSELIFVASGALAVAVFALFCLLLRSLGRERFASEVWRIRIGAFCILAVINLFYFTDVLPPLPLTAKAAGVYHSVVHVPGAYIASTEAEPWLVRMGLESPTFHVVVNGELAAYTSIFAPTALTTNVVDRWQYYDPSTKRWVTRLMVSYGIEGGRDSGYRGYSIASISTAGKWRVDVETADGLLIARLPFTAVFTSTPPALATTTLE